MKFTPNIAASICCFLLACSSAKTLDSGKSYNHMFIFCNTADIGARVQLEKDLAAAAAAKGHKVVKSIDIFPPSLHDPKPPSAKQIMDSLAAMGSDALFVMNLKRKEDIKYNPGVKVNETTPVISNLVAGSLGYRTDGNEIKGVDKPGSFAYENGFYITGDLVDSKTQAIVYSAISEIMEYSKLNTVGKAYMTRLIEQLETKRILKK